MPAGVAETDDFFPMARAIAAGTRPPATNRALAGSVPAPILFSSPFMPNPDLSILVVDDAKFSSAMIGRALSQAGYQDIRFASSASEALQQLEQRPVSVLLADWLMPEMDGLELTARVRQLDESINHYTYIVLLTGKEGENVLGEAFDRGVDDFVSKAAMNEQLVPRIYAADRLCNTLQRLLVENRLLTENIARMEERNLVDTLTGLGNPRYLRQKLADSLRQVETRGGALCYLLVGMPEAPVLRQRHGEAFHRELLLGVARRLQQLVRYAGRAGAPGRAAFRPDHPGGGPARMLVEQLQAAARRAQPEGLQDQRRLHQPESRHRHARPRQRGIAAGHRRTAAAHRGPVARCLCQRQDRNLPATGTALDFALSSAIRSSHHDLAYPRRR